MTCYVLAKYGEISHTTVFRTELADLKCGEKVVLRSDRGAELGVVVKPSFESETPPQEGLIGDVLRRLSPDDLNRLKQIETVDRRAEMKFCEERVAFHQLPMKIVDVEHLLGGEKIIFYFLAEGRVDFRQLVKDMAKEYRTRIELKQIGVRDEARLLADYDHCGREICCRVFIRDLEPVTMKMAKAQKATLDPTKISGRCGRLMCCLRYEDRVYEELKRKLPRKGSRVVTDRGAAEVIDYDVISQTLRVEGTDGRIMKVLMNEVKQVIPRDEKEYQRRQQERAQHGGQPGGEQASSGDASRPGRSRRSRGRRHGGEPRGPFPEAGAPAKDAPAADHRDADRDDSPGENGASGQAPSSDPSE